MLELGDGAGAGKNGVHGRNGLPQRFRFPANEDEGNLASVLGIEPFSWLLETLKSINPTVMLGR